MSERIVYDAALRHKLLVTARNLAAQEGWRSVGLRSVVQELSTSTNAVYTLYGSGVTLWREVSSALVLERADRWRELLRTADSAELGLLAVLEDFWAFFEEDPHLFELCFDGPDRESLPDWRHARDVDADEVLGDLFASAFDAVVPGGGQFAWSYLRGAAVLAARGVKPGTLEPGDVAGVVSALQGLGEPRPFEVAS